MIDEEKYKIALSRTSKPSPSGLFSVPYMDRVPAAKALNWLHQNDAIFVLTPTSEVCLESSGANGGVPPYMVRFTAFGKKAAKAIEKLPEFNPLFSFRQEFSADMSVYVTYGFSVTSVLTYSQFIDLVELSCEFLKDKGVLVKKFKVLVDFEITGKVTYEALPKGENFYSFLKDYEGEADLYDKSFMKYAGDLMTEYHLTKDYTNDNTRP